MLIAFRTPWDCRLLLLPLLTAHACPNIYTIYGIQLNWHNYWKYSKRALQFSAWFCRAIDSVLPAGSLIPPSSWFSVFKPYLKRASFVGLADRVTAALAFFAAWMGFSSLSAQFDSTRLDSNRIGIPIFWHEPIKEHFNASRVTPQSQPFRLAMSERVITYVSFRLG